MNFKKFLNKTKLSAAFLATLSVFILGCITTPKVFALSMNGSGTTSDPYIITSAEQLSEIRDNLTASYKLANDINLGDIDFIPIGSDNVPFTGTFDGNGHTIQNLNIYKPDLHQVGLFGSTNNATIKNLNISDANVVGRRNTGGLVGYARGNSTISNCSITGSSTVTGNDAGCAGGLVGYGSGLIEKSFTTTNVTASIQVGGLVGVAKNLTINECFTTGNVKALNNVGGLVGEDSIGLKMENCYSLSNIEATHHNTANAGGLLGVSKNSTINYCYSAGTIKGPDHFNGGLVGNDRTPAVINNSFYDGVKASLERGKACEMSSRLTTGMARQQSYADWNFDTIWTIDENTSYPYLKSLSKPSNVNMMLPLKDVEAGKGSIDDPYIISTKEQLNNVKFDLTANYKLANNIDLEGMDFTPIGSQNHPYIGTFDGNSHTIQNLKINRPNESYAGLFGRTKNATIKNLNISDANVVGYNHTGGLVGYFHDKSTISNCSVTGSSTVTSNAAYGGGLVGYGSGLIEKSFTTTTNVISPSINIGGLVGGAESLTINECFTEGNIKALNTVGGLVGIDIKELKMENCYSLSNIEATHHNNSTAGGLLGASKNSAINNCYSAGTIKGPEGFKGGLVGNNRVPAVINNSFYDGVKASLERRKSCEMCSRLTTGMARQQSYTNWNFDTIWTIDENTSYPYLKSLSKPSNVNMILPLKDVEAGKGSIDDPYIISTKEQLNNVKFDLIANYKLANNIDLEGMDFIPIGHEGTPYIGTFDGNGYTIQNLKIDKPNEKYVGLFGSTNNATIKNLNISDANVVGTNYTGGLVGCSSGKSTISNCSVTGSSTVTNNAAYAGGLVGYGSGFIEKSFTTTNVVSTSFNIGGLVGGAESLTINECFTTGNTKALNIVGGLVGIDIKGLKMENCYSLSNIEATHHNNSTAGGLLGASKNSAINNCYSAGTIKGPEAYKGALIGNNINTAVINNSFYDASVIGFTSESPYAKSTSEMMQSSTFIDWDFNNIWSIDEGATYPYFKKYTNTTPINLTAALNDNIVELSWNIVSDTKSYEVKRSLTAGGPYTTIATIPADTNSYSDNDVIGGTTYYYIITALNSLVGQSNSNEVTVNVPKPTDLDAPTIINFGRDGGAYISWNKVKNATEYNVKRSSTAGGPYTTIATVPADTNDCGFYDKSADRETGYYYVVSAVNGDVESINSEEIFACPRDLRAYKVDNTVELEWFTLSEDTSYSIKRSTTPNGPYTYIATDIDAPKYTTRFTDNDINTGTTYFYIVETKLSSGEVQSSQEISITP
jgi:fibronectin-binding autotransporter adhesin